MQALHLLALEPAGMQGEQCDINLAKRKFPKWTVEAGVKGCFDNISHRWVLMSLPAGTDGRLHND